MAVHRCPSEEVLETDLQHRKVISRANYKFGLCSLLNFGRSLVVGQRNSYTARASYVGIL